MDGSSIAAKCHAEQASTDDGLVTSLHGKDTHEDEDEDMVTGRSLDAEAFGAVSCRDVQARI